eukprot:CAMPEP_0172491654 /NCGR_PEP_ID=MMETSP1066-20121228/22533_1 /TAXON_ID=671091 /ORGANISM="Coscinodiscus wailesii, Strain CCMP2513" /LENGTH=125 /DNA_ID=CAMNT_0013260815 /DNA_START=114 /DNA_END=491 /DNA_ORIENTATION=+
MVQELITQRKRTVGEELYLVHLQRSHHHSNSEDSEDDRDVMIDVPRKRSRSMGDELFSVHLKRSEGCSFDCDVDGGSDKGTVDSVPLPTSQSSHCHLQDIVTNSGTDDDIGMKDACGVQEPTAEH